MGPIVAQKAGNAPKHAQRFDGASGFGFAHVGDLPAELIEIPRTVVLALSSLPQMNMVGFPPLNCGLTIAALPTELNALTKCASGNSFCSCSISDWSSLVKNLSTPFDRRCVRDRIGGVDHRFACEISRRLPP